MPFYQKFVVLKFRRISWYIVLGKVSRMLIFADFLICSYPFLGPFYLSHISWMIKFCKDFAGLNFEFS